MTVFISSSAMCLRTFGYSLKSLSVLAFRREIGHEMKGRWLPCDPWTWSVFPVPMVACFLACISVLHENCPCFITDRFKMATGKSAKHDHDIWNISGRRKINLLSPVSSSRGVWWSRLVVVHKGKSVSRLFGDNLVNERVAEQGNCLL